MLFRIAPTPSGFLHVGNAFNFVLTALLARTTGAVLRLRIDDADATRARAEYLADIFKTLQLLGIRWNEGPRDGEDHALFFSQNLRAGRYADTIQALIATRSVFACNCSRKDILAINADGQYPGTCREKNLPLDTPDTALRMLTPSNAFVQFNDVILGEQKFQPYAIARDPVIRRRDGLPAYHIASLTDDIDFGVTHIVRGADLLGSTAIQLFLSHALGGTAFDAVTFYHHPLLTNESGEKLSKSAGGAAQQSMWNRGIRGEEIYRRFSVWMGWPHAAGNFAQALKLFEAHGAETLKRPASSQSFAE